MVGKLHQTNTGVKYIVIWFKNDIDIAFVSLMYVFVLQVQVGRCHCGPVKDKY